MKKTVFICGLALLTAACTCDYAREREYQDAEQYAYEQPVAPQPQQATITYRSYVQASYSRPVRQQVVYKQPVQVVRPVVVQQPVVQQPVMQQPTCPCAQRRTCPCGC